MDAQVTCWLGPYFVQKRRTQIGRAGLAWQIVTASGFVIKTRIAYKVDAEALCQTLNQGPKVQTRGLLRIL